MVKKFFILASVVMSFFLFTPPSFAAPGELDPSFDGDGITFITFEDLYPNFDAVTSGASGVRQFPDGSIYVSGTVIAAILSPLSIDTDFTLSRLNSDGSLDGTFGNGGRVTTDFLPNYQGSFTISADVNTDMAVRPDGKIVLCGISFVVGGSPTTNFAVSVYNQDGSLDSTFNPAGPLPGTLIIEPVTPSPFSSANSVAIQDDNKILLAGLTIDPTNFFDITVIRLNTDGSFDTSFNPSGPTPGILTLNLLSTPSVEIPLSILYLSDTDQIVVGGTGTFLLPNLLDFALIKLNLDGSFDTGFGTGGVVNTDVLGASQDILYSLELQSTGQLVAVGSTDTTTSAVRYNSADGSLDGSFGNSGVFNTAGIDGTDTTLVVNAMNSAIQNDDSVFIVGSSGSDIALAKILSNGQLDTAFNPSGPTPGIVHTDVGAGSADAGRATAVQTDGKVLVAGSSNALGAGGQQVVLRYLGNTADLEIVKSTFASFPLAGETFAYDITVTNHGPDTAVEVVVTDVLPAGLALASIQAGQGSCTGTATLTCELGNIAAGSSVTIALNVTVVEVNTYENTATVTAQVIDPDESNNSSTVTVVSVTTQGGCIGNTLTPGPSGMERLLYGVAILVPLIAFGVFRRRKAKSFRLVLFWIFFLGAAVTSVNVHALTQSFSTAFFKPAVDDSDYLSLYSSPTLKQRNYHFGLWLDYAKDSYEIQQGSGIVEHMLTGNFVGAYGVNDWFSVGGRLPVYFWEGIRAPPLGRPDENHISLGDFELDLKFRLVNREKHRVGVSVVPFVTFPTATHAVRDFTGNGNFTGGGRLVVDGKVFDRLTLALNAGIEGRGQVTDIGGNKIGSHFMLGAGFDVDIIKKQLKIIGETQIETVMTDFFSKRRTTPAEARLGIRYRFKNGINVNAAGGMGYTNGIASPEFRAILGVTYTSDRWNEFTLKEPEPPIDEYWLEEQNWAKTQVGDELKLKDKIYFEYNQTEIRNVCRPTLDRLAAFLKKHPEFKKIRIEGNTCDLGGDKYNLRLSERRAASVADYLVSQGVERSRFHVVGWGKSRPLVPNLDEAHREQNRRVQIFVEEKQ